MSTIDRDNLTVTGDSSDNVLVRDENGVTIIVTQAFGPRGDSVMGIGGVTFDGYPAITVRVRTATADGLVHLSPFHGDPRKQTDLDIAAGAVCELLCPVSGEPLTEVDTVDDPSCPQARYYAIFLTPRLSHGDMVVLSSVWDHYHSRVIDEFELLSIWASDED